MFQKKTRITEFIQEYVVGSTWLHSMFFFLAVNGHQKQNQAESMAMFVYFTFGKLTLLEDNGEPASVEIF